MLPQNEMSGSDDLYGVYRAGHGRRRILDGEGYAAALIANVRETFSTMERLTAEVATALTPAGYTIRFSPFVEDRNAHVRIDRTSEAFADYLRNWSQLRAEQGHLGLHWEMLITVTDHRRVSAEIGLAVTIERPSEDGEPDRAFVEFWTTGKGMGLPSGAEAYQRALIGAIVRLEEKDLIRSRQRPQR
jgi:hypothetical protein